jgi:hypothetical protein
MVKHHLFEPTLSMGRCRRVLYHKKYGDMTVKHWASRLVPGFGKVLYERLKRMELTMAKDRIIRRIKT